MLERVGLRLVGEVGWGVKARVYVGAVASIADLGTDLTVCYIFWEEKRMDYFEMTLGTVLLSMSIQLLVVFMQNRKRGVRKVFLEAIPVLIGLKPAVDAFRVAGGVREEAGVFIDNMVEMTLNKSVELFAEAIPGVIIQLLAIATADGEVGEVSVAAWLSLSASLLSAGFIGSTIS